MHCGTSALAVAPRQERGMGEDPHHVPCKPAGAVLLCQSCNDQRRQGVDYMLLAICLAPSHCELPGPLSADTTSIG